MTVDPIDILGYRDAPAFVPLSRLGALGVEAPQIARLARHCTLRGGALRGVYLLDGGREQRPAPVVYVANVADADDARRVHQATWNQGTVPFLIACSPEGVWLYSGFDYDREIGKAGRLTSLIEISEIAKRLRELQADAINDGRVWRRWGSKLDPERRVSHVLLKHLSELTERLKGDGLAEPIAHALIGKFIYLRFLYDRELLDAERLANWGLSPAVFERGVTLADFKRLVSGVESWLNGAVFPVDLDGPNGPTEAQFARLAATFLGDDPRTGQAHLDFRAYDFAFIPIELLSNIYEQFLAESGGQQGKGAWYTPLPVVDFMLDELAAHRPLTAETRMLDPACGSGAFLVQCFRLLVAHVAMREGALTPDQLKALMTTRIFGIDRDSEACQVAVLSLALALLDALEPGALRDHPDFQLPTLLGQNILHRDFFDAGFSIEADWVVGNPPWQKLSSKDPEHAPALAWLDETGLPAPDHQAAEAFAWRCLDWLAPDGCASLLIPSMSLYQEASHFRAAFFARVCLRAVADLTNLREVLFAGRARHACAAITFDAQSERATHIPVFAPWLLNQEVNRPAPGRREAIWYLSKNASEVHALPVAALDGASLPFKQVRWGGWRLGRTIARIRRCFPALFDPEAEEDFCRAHGLARPFQGLKLRSARENAAKQEPSALVHLPSLAGKPVLDVKKVPRSARLYRFPARAIAPLDGDRAWCDERGGTGGLRVCAGPQVIVHAARNYAVYGDGFLIVPPRQIGIAGPPESADMLKALSLYLVSDFVHYFELVHATQVETRGVSTLKTLKKVPIPLDRLSPRELTEWAGLQAQLAEASAARFPPSDKDLPLFDGTSDGDRGRLEALEAELNQRVNTLLGLSKTEVALINDVLAIFLPLADGKIAGPALASPTQADQQRYAQTLKAQLDAFLGADHPQGHMVQVVTAPGTAARWGAVQVRLANGPGVARVLRADEQTRSTLSAAAKALESLRKQWLYFERNLFVHQTDQSIIGKPMQRFWWTETQAIADADTLIATALTSER